MSYDLTLQQNNITQKFILLPNEEKIKCIELGLCLLENGNDKMYSMNNEEWQEKLNIMKEEINNQKEKCSKLIGIHKRELEELSQQIRNSCQVSFENEINFPFIINGDKYPILQTTIKLGTPYVQVIPFKRNDWKMKINFVKNKNLIKTKISFFENIIDNYKNKIWKKKKWT